MISKLILALLKNSFFAFELEIIDVFKLILSLNNNLDWANWIKIGLILNKFDILWLSKLIFNFKSNGLIDISPS